MGDPSEPFMSRPTEVYASYMARDTGFAPEYILSKTLRPGRIAMGLEIITVVRTLELIQLEAEYEHTITVLMTLLVDQGLMDQVTETYELLNEWRKIKLARGGGVPAPDAENEDETDV